MIQQTPEVTIIDGITYQLDSDIPYTGKHTMYYDDGAKFSESYYKNGKEDGLWVTWDMDGHKCSESNHKDGERHGAEIYWYNNDVISTKGQHHKDKRIGIWRSWHTNGNISHKGEYKNNKKHGLWTYWYSRKTFDNVYSSKIEEQIATKMNYANGVLNGTCIEWHSNGNKKMEGKYIANIDKNRQHKTGVWSYWNEGGKLTDKETYREGILNGELV